MPKMQPHNRPERTALRAVRATTTVPANPRHVPARAIRGADAQVNVHGRRPPYCARNSSSKEGSRLATQ